MTIADALQGSALPRAEAELLIACALKAGRTDVLAHPERVLENHEAALVTEFFERRRKGEPMGYILGHIEFFGRMFKADSRALIPRSPTESLVELAIPAITLQKEEVKKIDTGIVAWSHKLRDPGLPIETIVEIGTGAGCIAISLALALQEIRVIGTDVSSDALFLAKENAHALDAEVDWRLGNALEPLKDLTEPFLLISNPPYIPAQRSMDPSVKDFEPHVALFGGEDGTDVTRLILSQAQSHPHCTGWIIECEEAQQKIFELEFRPKEHRPI